MSFVENTKLAQKKSNVKFGVKKSIDMDNQQRKIRQNGRGFELSLQKNSVVYFSFDHDHIKTFLNHIYDLIQYVFLLHVFSFSFCSVSIRKRILQSISVKITCPIPTQLVKPFPYSTTLYFLYLTNSKYHKSW